ncbi:MAG TPA: hypothetical protein DCZ95_15295 [Verrucomicrobia bacterium]|nr:MAG: hypothetical protein A2X46_19050 [Lentisphaerae bacterium GWF2_57_35]HBA85450.1 hypothetical protein [Verrucomicrobiota bacterium]
MRKHQLLVSVRGSNEALEAAQGGAQIVDVEYPASALGAPYPLNIAAVRTHLTQAGFQHVRVSTNIGEFQSVRASACQAALGVAFAGADLIKFGLAEQTLASASYLADTIVRTVRSLASEGKKLIPAIFVDEDMRRFFDPFMESFELAKQCKADGILIDTYNKLIGKGLLDYCKPEDLAAFARGMHSLDKEAWISGSIRLKEMPTLWQTGVDVICVRSAACVKEEGTERFGKVSRTIVSELAATLPESSAAEKAI